MTRLLACLALLLAACGLALPASAQTPAAAPATAAAPVKVGVYINDIQAIDLRNHAFSADIYVWFRNQDETLQPGSTFEFMNVVNANDHTQTALQKDPLPQPDGSKYELFRHQGLFSTKFSVRTYPFDRQTLKIEIEDQQNTADRQTYVVDEISMNPNVQIPGYDISKPTMTIINKAYPTAFGDLANPQALPYSRAIISIPIARPALSGAIKIFLPILIIMMVAAAALVLDPSHVDARVGLAITALLTLVALQFTVSQNLPEVGYLLMLDQVYLASYAFILLVVAMLVRASRVDDAGIVRGTPGALHKLVRGGPALAFISMLGYLVVVGTIVIINLA
ncbi:MAG: hypothetical protein ABI740_09375 [Alphaproteobacteria bacterium]